MVPERGVGRPLNVPIAVGLDDRQSPWTHVPGNRSSSLDVAIGVEQKPRVIPGCGAPDDELGRPRRAATARQASPRRRRADARTV